MPDIGARRVPGLRRGGYEGRFAAQASNEPLDQRSKGSFRSTSVKRFRREAIRASGSEQSNLRSRAATLRKREPTRFSSASDDEVGGFPARSAPSEHGERGNQLSAPDGIRTHAGAGLSRLPLPFGLRGPAIERPV